MLGCKNLCFCSVVIFVNIVRFPPLRYCQISSAIAETALYSRLAEAWAKERKGKRTEDDVKLNFPFLFGERVILMLRPHQKYKLYTDFLIESIHLIAYNVLYMPSTVFLLILEPKMPHHGLATRA